MLMWLCFIGGFFAPWCFAIAGLLFMSDFFRIRSKSYERESVDIALTNRPVTNEITFDGDKIFIELPLEWYEVVKKLQQFTDPDEDLVFKGYSIENERLRLEFRKRSGVKIKKIDIQRKEIGYSINIDYEEKEENEREYIRTATAPR